MKYNFQGVYSGRYMERVEFDTEGEARDYAEYLAGDWNDKVFAREAGEQGVLITAPQPQRAERQTE